MERRQPSIGPGEIPSRQIFGARIPKMLEPDVEQALCHRWHEHHDISAAHQLASCHQHVVVEIATAYRRYGLPSEELIGEGQVGLMRAICRFDPDRGVRFAKYASCWVRAAIQQHILHHWPRPKVGGDALNANG
jgi:RNA polymerase sigma-32 factor